MGESVRLEELLSSRPVEFLTPSGSTSPNASTVRILATNLGFAQRHILSTLTSLATTLLTAVVGVDNRLSIENPFDRKQGVLVRGGDSYGRVLARFH